MRNTFRHVKEHMFNEFLKISSSLGSLRTGSSLRGTLSFARTGSLFEVASLPPRLALLHGWPPNFKWNHGTRTSLDQLGKGNVSSWFQNTGNRQQLFAACDRELAANCGAVRLPRASCNTSGTGCFLKDQEAKIIGELPLDMKRKGKEKGCLSISTTQLIATSHTKAFAVYPAASKSWPCHFFHQIGNPLQSTRRKMSKVCLW